MKRCIKKYLFGQVNNQHGAVTIAAAVGIAFLSLIGAAVYYDVPGAVDEYAASLTRMRNGESTGEDLMTFHNSLDALRNAGGGLPIPSGADDVLAISLGLAQGYALDIALAEPPPPPPAGTGLSGGCTMTLSTTNVLLGDTITATLTTPTLFHSKIGNISCAAGVEGFGIPIPEGTSPVKIPDSLEADILTIKCNVIASEGGDTICSPAVKVSIPGTVIWEGREWQRSGNNIRYYWGDAFAYCENLELAGNNDWRLPSIEELKSLVVCTSGIPTPLVSGNCGGMTNIPYRSPTIDTQFSCQPWGYWSANVVPKGQSCRCFPDRSDCSCAWAVLFGNGYSWWYNNHADYYARCVRDIF